MQVNRKTRIYSLNLLLQENGISNVTVFFQIMHSDYKTKNIPLFFQENDYRALVDCLKNSSLVNMVPTNILKSSLEEWNTLGNFKFQVLLKLYNAPLTMTLLTGFCDYSVLCSFLRHSGKHITIKLLSIYLLPFQRVGIQNLEFEDWFEMHFPAQSKSFYKPFSEDLGSKFGCPYHFNGTRIRLSTAQLLYYYNSCFNSRPYSN